MVNINRYSLYKQKLIEALNAFNIRGSWDQKFENHVVRSGLSTWMFAEHGLSFLAFKIFPLVKQPSISLPMPKFYPFFLTVTMAVFSMGTLKTRGLESDLALLLTLTSYVTLGNSLNLLLKGLTWGHHWKNYIEN